MTFTGYNWRSYLTKIQKQAYLIIGITTFLLFSLISGGVWYYFQHQESEKENTRLRAEQEHVRKVKAVNDYYADILTGVTIHQFLEVMYEINKSKTPLMLSGFDLAQYTCDIQKCSFKFKSKSGSIFSVQELFFSDSGYKANISEDGLEYEISPSPLTHNTLLKKLKARQDIPVAGCSELVNYIHSFNSSANSVKSKLSLSGYPQTSISSIDNVLPDLKDKYDFLNVQWSVTLPDNILELSFFLIRQAYNSSFLIKKVEKKSSAEVEISGTILCVN
ncbi:Uncharacterised protein [Edwardsiella tarda]|nr:Uncharacterised protein [Edwardsiella tarda]